MWASLLPKIIVPVALSLLGKKFQQDVPQGGFMSKFGKSMAGLYAGDKYEIPPVEFKHSGSGDWWYSVILRGLTKKYPFKSLSISRPFPYRIYCIINCSY